MVKKKREEISFNGENIIEEWKSDDIFSLDIKDKLCFGDKLDGYYHLNYEEILPFDNDSLSEVIANNFFNTISEKETLIFLHEVYRVLKSDGIFSHITKNSKPDDIYGNIHTKDCCTIYAWKIRFIYWDVKKEEGLTFKFIHKELYQKNGMIHCTYGVYK